MSASTVSTIPDTPSMAKETADETVTPEVSLSAEEQRRVMRKIDLRVTVVLGVINCISLMDRSNLGAAAVAGMGNDLHLYQGNRYSVAALVFFIPYIVFEFPSAILVRKVGARPLLMSVCLLWGAVMIATGFVTNWKQLAAVRALLGFLESVFAPVVLFLLSTWYTRYEVQKRFALFFVVTIVVTSFNGILVFGLMQMRGLAGLQGWRWTFIMEGILTVVMGMIAGAFIVDFPDKARSSLQFLNDDQMRWVMHRLQEDRGDANAEPFSWGKFLGSARYIPIWFFAVIFCCCTTIAYSVGFFLPIILQKEMGFSKGAALCLAAPPYLFSAITMCIAGWLGDKYRQRAPILFFNAFMTIIGLVLFGWMRSSGVRYFSLFIINGAVLANIPTVMAYSTNNIRGHWMRAFASATFVVGGGLGGVFGALVFGNGSASAAVNGVLVCIAVNVLLVSVVVGLTLFFNRENCLARRGRKVIHGHPGFFYSL